MAKADPFEAQNRPLDVNLLRYVWRHTRSEQLWILFVIILSLIPYFMVLDLPVRIVNQPIQGVGFEQVGATQKFLELSLSLPSFLGGATWEIFEGFDLERWPFLIALSCTFLALVCINGLFKFYINTYKGRLGERMLRRMRYQLVDRVLRFPMQHFKRVKGSEVASMVKDEVEPFGEFIGDAFVQPVYLGGQALVAFTFIMQQSFWLGMIAVGIIAVQVTLIPHLRKRVLELGRMRQLTARLLSGRIGEIVDGISAVHVNDTSNYERAEVSNRLGKIFFIRYELYQRKFFIKFINNFLAQLTPFLFYVVGGYFAIRGSLNVGQLLGVINAYKDLPSPINGLIMWDQKRVDINIKYAQIVDQFNVRGMSDARLQAASTEPVPPLEGNIEISNLRVVDDTGSALIEDADFRLPISGVTAAVGPLGSGAGATADVLAGLLEPSSGRIRVNGQSLTELPQSVRGRRFAYAGSDSYLPQGTLFDTLLYVTKHAPLIPSAEGTLERELHQKAHSETIASGNSVLDYYADWVDYDAMGISSKEEVYDRLHEILELVEMDEVIYELAMRQPLLEQSHEPLRQELLAVRKKLRERLSGSSIENLVEVWDRNEYNEHATIAENLIFGTAVEADEFATTELIDNDHLQRILAQENLDKDLFALGMDLAETAIDLFSDLSPDNPFFEQLNFMTPEQLEDYPPILSRAREFGFENASDADKRMLIKLPFGYIERRNRLKLLDEELQNRILAARAKFRDTLPDTMSDDFNFFELNTYNPMNSVQDNILFGRVASGSSNADEEVRAVIRSLITESGLQDDMFRLGLEFDIGTGGRRLPENHRQRIILARALLKGGDLVILNRALNALDVRSQERLVLRVLERARGEKGARPFGLFWVLTSPHMAEHFDQAMLFGRHRLIGMDKPNKLMAENEQYAALVA